MKVKDLKKLLENVDGEVPLRLMKNIEESDGELIAKVEVPMRVVANSRIGTVVEVFIIEDTERSEISDVNEAGLP